LGLALKCFIPEAAAQSYLLFRVHIMKSANTSGFAAFLPSTVADL
jgi:hypothetical protein